MTSKDCVLTIYANLLLFSTMLNHFFIASDNLNIVRRFLEAKGLDLPDLKEKLNDHKERNLTYAQWWELLEEVGNAYPHPAIGIAIGQYATISDCGVLGYLSQTGHHLGEALACFQRFQKLLYSGGEAHTELDANGDLQLIWDASDGYSSLISDGLLLAAIVNVCRTILRDKSLAPPGVEFTHNVPINEQTFYQDYFGCRVKFGQANLRLSIPAEILNRPIPGRDAALHALLNQQAANLLQKVPEPDSFITRLRHTLIRCMNEGTPQAAYAAAILGISERTLHRRLESKGKMFRDLLKEVRQSLSEQYLRDPKLSLAEIALLLGYAEQSPFNRAFQQWYGVSPGRYREKLRRSG